MGSHHTYYIQSWCWVRLGSHGFTITPMTDTTWAAVTLLLACSQSFPPDCSPHTSSILEDPWGILNTVHAAYCPISTFFRGGNKVAACSWKSFMLDIILRICLPALPSSSCLSLVGAFYAVKYRLKVLPLMLAQSLTFRILVSSFKVPSSFEPLWCLQFTLLILGVCFLPDPIGNLNVLV